MALIDIDQLLAVGAGFKKVVKGEYIFREGTQCNFYYQLVEGKIRWASANDEGREYLYEIIEPGDCFGEIPLFDNEPFAADAVADEDSVVIRLQKATFHQFLIDNPDILLSITGLLARRLRFKFFMLKELMNHEPEQRIVALIEYLKKNKHYICCKCGRVNLTRQQIANMTCLRVETVIRAMRNMHEQGTIDIKKGKVYCADMVETILGKL